MMIYQIHIFTFLGIIRQVVMRDLGEMGLKFHVKYCTSCKHGYDIQLPRLDMKILYGFMDHDTSLFHSFGTKYYAVFKHQHLSTDTGDTDYVKPYLSNLKNINLHT